MEFKRFLHTFKRMIWLIILLGLLGGGIAAYMSGIINSNNKPMYVADTTIYTLAKAENNQTGIYYQDLTGIRQLANDYQDIIKSEKVTSLIEKEVKDLNLSQSEIKNMISVTAQEKSNIVVISGFSPKPGDAKIISDAAAKCFIETLSNLTDTNMVGVIDTAKEPVFPISDRNGKTLTFGNTDYSLNMILIGLAIGMLTAFAIIFAVDFFDTTIRTCDDIEHYTDISILGIVPNIDTK